jgi:alkylation response protein AidB-like acyl-CoA dehydrogenase
MMHPEAVACMTHDSIARMRRGVKVHAIVEGTSEIQQPVIARAIIGTRVE